MLLSPQHNTGRLYGQAGERSQTQLFFTALHSPPTNIILAVRLLDGSSTESQSGASGLGLDGLVVGTHTSTRTCTHARTHTHKNTQKILRGWACSVLLSSCRVRDRNSMFLHIPIRLLSIEHKSGRNLVNLQITVHSHGTIE